MEIHRPPGTWLVLWERCPLESSGFVVTAIKPGAQHGSQISLSEVRSVRWNPGRTAIRQLGPLSPLATDHCGRWRSWLAFTVAVAVLVQVGLTSSCPPWASWWHSKFCTSCAQGLCSSCVSWPPLSCHSSSSCHQKSFSPQWLWVPAHSFLNKFVQWLGKT